MFSKYRKKGQAAIEFLMTYGWMLLVVLIVGALIFSFVDFGSLLPNKLELSNNLRGDSTKSIAYSEEYSEVSKRSEVRVVFTYIGSNQAQINYKEGEIIDSFGNKCLSYRIENLDTGNKGGCND